MDGGRLIYTLLTKGQDYVDRGQKYYEREYENHVVENLQKRIQTMGFALTPGTGAACMKTSFRIRRVFFVS